jgi:hypothetical protein
MSSDVDLAPARHVCPRCGAPVRHVPLKTGQIVACDDGMHLLRPGEARESIIAFEGVVVFGSLEPMRPSRTWGHSIPGLRPHETSCPSAPTIAVSKNCEGCKAPLVMIKLKSGRYMPCDPTKETIRVNQGGSRTIITESGMTVRGDALEAPGRSLTGYPPHWASCPHRLQFRKEG